MEIISLCFERVMPLGFWLATMWRKMFDSRVATVCTVFHVYSLIKCLYVRLCLWSVCHPYFLFLFCADSQQVKIVFHYSSLKRSVHQHSLSSLPWLCPFNILFHYVSLKSVFLFLFFFKKERKKKETRLKHTKRL